MPSRPADLVIANFGARGTGKTSRVLQLMRERRELWPALVFDPQDEYHQLGQITATRSLGQLGELMRAGKAARFVPDDTRTMERLQFDAVCRLAYAFPGYTLIVDELADVAPTNDPPEWWAVITRKGRHRGVRVIASSQRPAHIDVEVITSATVILCSRLGTPYDRAKIANNMDIHPDELRDLEGFAYIAKRVGYPGVVRYGADGATRAAEPAEPKTSAPATGRA